METIDYPITDPGRTTIVAQTDNGFLLTTFTEYINEPGSFTPIQRVVEDNDEIGYAQCVENWDSVYRMLWELLEMLEIHTSKHEPKSIDIKVIDQD